jgi:hypothetical protein
MQQALKNITGKGEAPKSLGSAAAGTAFGKEAPEFNPEKFGDEADKLNKPGEKKKKSPYGNMR